MIGLELVVPVLLDLVRRGALPLARLVDALTRAPARIAALDAPALREGRRAEICVIDTERAFTVSRASIRSRSINTPFFGKTFTGAVALTLAGGRVVHDVAG
jgi:dihydroorotase